MSRAQIEIVGYHVADEEQDYIQAWGDGQPRYLSLRKLVALAGGATVDWGVMVAHERARAGIDLDVFADYLTKPLPPLKRYRLTLEILDEPERGAEEGTK